MENKSGILPNGNRILVKQDKIEKTTSGGIFIPDVVSDRHQQSACFGYVIEIGPDSSRHTTKIIEGLVNGIMKMIGRETTGYSEPLANAGDRVIWVMYSGVKVTGEDGDEYHLVNDEDIVARISKGVTQTSIEARKRVGG